MKKKGVLEAFFTKATGINVGDHINKFRKTFEVATKAPTYDSLMAVFKAATSLEKALTSYANQKEFGSNEAKDFKKAVLDWAKETGDYANTFGVELKRNEKVLREKGAEQMVAGLQNSGLL